LTKEDVILKHNIKDHQLEVVRDPLDGNIYLKIDPIDLE